MNLQKVHHIAIIGSDYEKSKTFLCRYIGFFCHRENYRPEAMITKLTLNLMEWNWNFSL